MGKCLVLICKGTAYGPQNAPFRPEQFGRGRSAKQIPALLSTRLPCTCAEHPSWTAPCVLGRGLQVEGIPSLQPGGRPASGKLGSCLQSGGQGVQASLVPRSGFWTTGNQVLELTEKHKPTVDPQLASLQVSDPANMPDILFHMFYLSQVLQHRTPLETLRSQ